MNESGDPVFGCTLIWCVLLFIALTIAAFWSVGWYIVLVVGALPFVVVAFILLLWGAHEIWTGLR